MTIRSLTYHRVSADRVRELIRENTQSWHFGDVALVDQDGAMLVADANSPGSVAYTGRTFSDFPGIGRFDVLYPKAGLTDHGYVTNEAAVK